MPITASAGRSRLFQIFCWLRSGTTADSTNRGAPDALRTVYLSGMIRPETTFPIIGRPTHSLADVSAILKSSSQPVVALSDGNCVPTGLIEDRTHSPLTSNRLVAAISGALR